MIDQEMIDRKIEDMLNHTEHVALQNLNAIGLEIRDLVNQVEVDRQTIGCLGHSFSTISFHAEEPAGVAHHYIERAKQKISEIFYRNLRLFYNPRYGLPINWRVCVDSFVKIIDDRVLIVFRVIIANTTDRELMETARRTMTIY